MARKSKKAKGKKKQSISISDTTALSKSGMSKETLNQRAEAIRKRTQAKAQTDRAVQAANRMR